ncbi:transcription factor TFIIIB component B homolog isoform X1 [Prunus yedoensis var. nudiflora]|uniref:Transcription factor TFIIIB component B homolog isoform X1 n=1 Tax=Prunus yedoensis var. nudiflora TaxID=2094558 RepID=A0A314UG47_PRUYE|nr:transcription factor TFIIIB component B homolog isoform X1 [Prunus yedoensis var. nudiflora]
MEDLDDIFLDPSNAPARPGGRFRPKAKPRPSKVASTAAASALPNDRTEKPATLSPTVSDTVPSVKSIDVGVVKVTDPVGSSLATSEILGNIEPAKNNENLCTNVASSEGNKDTEPCKSAATAAPQPEVAASVGTAAGENADIFSGLECLDGFLGQTTRGTAESAASKSHVSAESSAFMVCDVAEAQTFSDCCTTKDPVSCREVSVSNKLDEVQLETKVDGAFSEFEVLDVVSDATILSGQRVGKFQPKLKVKKGKEHLHIPPAEVKCTLSQAVLVPSETDMNESSLPAFPPGHVLDHPSPRFGDSSTPHPTSDPLVNTEYIAETTHSDGAIGDAVHSEDVGGTPGKEGHKSRNRKGSTASNRSQKSKSFAASEEAEGGTSSRKLRKRLPRQEVEELVDEANEDSFTAEPSSGSNVNEDENNDNEYREHKTSQRKRAPRKSKEPESGKEPVQKRKRAKEAPDKSTKDPPKRFSHSTRRTKRHVDKSLLEIPEDEIDHQRLSLKNLIRLAEHRELLAIKEARKMTTPVPDESANNDSHKEAYHDEENEEENFPSEHDRNSEENQASYRVNASSFLLNYQSYMDKTPTIRWSKQDTELFYEAIQQCGSDFTMIQELYFPGRTRHQIKLKFKKEERQNPLRINEAVLSRSTCSTDHSQFTSYIERLQQVAQANKEEEAEPTHDTDEGVKKTELEEPEDQEADVAEVQEEAVDAEVDNPLKSDEIDDEEFTWSE